MQHPQPSETTSYSFLTFQEDWDKIRRNVENLNSRDKNSWDVLCGRLSLIRTNFLDSSEMIKAVMGDLIKLTGGY